MLVSLDMDLCVASYYLLTSGSVLMLRFDRDNSPNLLVGHNPRWINPCEQTCNQLLNPILTSFKASDGHQCLALCAWHSSIPSETTKGRSGSHSWNSLTDGSEENLSEQISQTLNVSLRFLWGRRQSVDTTMCQNTSNWHLCNVTTELVTFLKTQCSTILRQGCPRRYYSFCYFLHLVGTLLNCIAQK